MFDKESNVGDNDANEMQSEGSDNNSDHFLTNDDLEKGTGSKTQKKVWLLNFSSEWFK